jgi:hypothetical protein
MGHEIALANAHPESALRVYRSAAATSGSDGAWVQLVLDTVSPKMVAVDFELTDGRLVPLRPANLSIAARVSVEYVGGLSRLYARIVVERWDEDTETYTDEEHATLSSDGAAGELAVFVSTHPRLDLGDRIRFDVRTDGAASVALNTGDSATWGEARHV